MAVRIHEYDRARVEHPSYGFTRPGAPTVSQTPITATSTSAQSSAFVATTRIVTVDSDEDVHVVTGATPTATTSHPKVKAGVAVDLWVEPGHKLAVRTA